MRLRQLVIATGDFEAGAKLRDLLGLGEPYCDPGVAEFGLENEVFAVGDQFLEVIYPISDAAPARRFVDRTEGGGGYMAIFQTNDIAAVRRRATENKVRRVWEVDLEDISATHLHPADMGAAIVSVDEPRPADSWRWAGPDWIERRGEGLCAGLAGLELTASDPERLLKRWANILGLAHDAAALSMPLTGGDVTVSEGLVDGISTFVLFAENPDEVLQRAEAAGLPCESGAIQFGGVRFSFQRPL